MAHDPFEFLTGGGEMGRHIREKDWSKTPLGPIESWPQSLRTTVSLCLNSNFPIAIAWGPERTQIYNDGYWPICGAKHPHSMGQDFRECWFSAWPAIGGAFDTATGGQSAFLVNQRMFLDRNGYLEETFFTFSFSPIRAEAGNVGGLFHPVTELTQQSLSERRLRILRDLADRTADVKSVEATCGALAQVFGEQDLDLPFTLLYLLDEPAHALTLTASTGLAAGSDFAPGEVRAGAEDPWQLHTAVDERKTLELTDLATRFPGIACGPYPEAPEEAFVLPILVPGMERPFGVLVAGVSSRRALDEPYRAFYLLLRDAVANALTNARAYQEERRRAEALAAIDRAKTAFFSNVSHEFRTPLTLMLGPVEDSLADPAAPLPPEQRERMLLARRSALRLQKLVNSLLDFSRIEAGRAQASYQATDLAPLTADLASTFRSAMEKAGIELAVDCAPLPEPAWVDREMWEKIVLNLLSNAFKHTFEGRVTITLQDGDGQFVLAVRDTGIGIAASELPHIFERFRRVEGARSRTHEGTGIGLALVQELARLHGGTVEVESEEGRGSLFRVTIPKGNAHLPADRIGAARTLASTSLGAESFVEEALRWIPDVATPSQSPGPGAAASAHRPRILLADDNADMRQYVRGLLAAHYDVEAVADGHDALEAVHKRRPDVLVTDVMMPRIDGLELVRRLRADPRTTTMPVLVLSARAGEDSRIEGLDAGADDYLFKPFSARELMARVGALVRASELRDESARQQQAALAAEQALSESERKLQTLIANLPGMAYSCPTIEPWPLTFASEGVIDLTGIPAQAFMNSELSWAEIIFEEDVQAVSDEVSAALAEHRSFEMTYRIRHRDGSTRWMLDRGRGIYDAAGEPVAIEGFVLDLTRQLAAEEALREADRRKDEFLATLSHELRNPLAPLKSSLELIREGAPGTGVPAGAPDPKVLAMMQRQLDHLVRLVDDLLELSRISRGVIVLRKTPLALSDVVRGAVEACRPLLGDARRQVETDVADPAPWVEGDAVRLTQVVSNLLNNAIRFTGRDGRIVVRAGAQGGRATVVVEDNGAGFAPGDGEHLFDMFVRGSTSPGLGIGLALVRRIVELHGGSVEARSEGPGRGATFSFSLPTIEAPAFAAPEQRNAAAPVGACRILVADDNADAADILAILLETLGHEVVIARDGVEAVEQARKFRPEVAFLDVGMPRLDGYGAARQIRSELDGQAPHLVALTGWGQDDDRRRAREAGFADHLVKPASVESIIGILAAVTEARAAKPG